MIKELSRAACAAFFCVAGSAQAAVITETTDFSNSLSLGSDNIGQLMTGLNSITGSLSGECVLVLGFSDCNSVGTDTQDSFLFTIANGFEIVSATFETFNSIGIARYNLTSQPTNFGIDGLGTFAPNLNGNSSYNLGAFDPTGLGLINFSFFGGSFAPLGSYSTDYTLAFDIAAIDISPTPVPAPAALPLFLSGLAAVGWFKRRSLKRAA